MRPAWSGTIAFGLVTLPVKLYSAVESAREVAFHLLDSKTLTPIKEIRVNPKTGNEVPWNRVVRGVEISKRRYVPLSREELAALPLPSAHTIDLFGFVEAGDVDPLLFDSAYYVAPGEGGTKPYALLREALEKLGMLGVGKIALRTREHLAVLRPHSSLLILHTIYFADEVREGGAVPGVPAHVHVQGAERRMAEQLITSMAGPFEYSRYKSDYKKALDQLIKAKLHDKELPAAPPPERKVIDLQEALRRSLEHARPRGSRHRRRRLRAAS
jgi:DNA end-binding protein Ku